MKIGRGRCGRDLQEKRLARNATNQATNAADTASGTAATYGGEAAGTNSTLTPFLTQQMLHPQGFSQQDQSAQLAAGLGAAGGSTSGITGVADQQAARTGNSAGFTSALDDAARQRSKMGAGVAEDVASKNAQLKQTQQQNAAEGLEGLNKTQTSAMLGAMGQVAPDVNAEVGAGKAGWLQNLTGIMSSLQGAGGKGYTL